MSTRLVSCCRAQAATCCIDLHGSSVADGGDSQCVHFVSLVLFTHCVCAAVDEQRQRLLAAERAEEEAQLQSQSQSTRGANIGFSARSGDKERAQQAEKSIVIRSTTSTPPQRVRGLQESDSSLHRAHYQLQLVRPAPRTFFCCLVS